MLDLARRNQAEAGVLNVEWLRGHIEEIPLPRDSVDVIISNCVINLSGDKPQVLREAARVLKPGGRFAVSDVVADDTMDDQTRADMQAYTGCIAGALTSNEFTDALQAAGLTDSASPRPTVCTPPPSRRSSAPPSPPTPATRRAPRPGTRSPPRAARPPSRAPVVSPPTRPPAARRRPPPPVAAAASRPSLPPCLRPRRGDRRRRQHATRAASPCERRGHRPGHQRRPSSVPARKQACLAGPPQPHGRPQTNAHRTPRSTGVSCLKE